MKIILQIFNRNENQLYIQIFRGPIKDFESYKIFNAFSIEERNFSLAKLYQELWLRLDFKSCKKMK